MGASQVSAKKLIDAALTEVDRFVDMRVVWMPEDEGGRIITGARPILDVGGRWDRDARAWAGPGDHTKVFGFHPGQLEAAEWAARWMTCKACGEVFLDNGRRIFSVLAEGGRRAGKTDWGGKLVCTLCVMKPGAVGWLVAETEAKTAELEEVVTDWLHPDWYTYLGAPWFTFTLWNGSVICLKSAHDPDKLKAGGLDIAAINEAQLISEKSFLHVRGGVSDTGGLVIPMANPPDKPVGFWVERFHDDAIARKRDARVFFFDNRKNPHVDQGALESLRNEMDERTYQREVLGMFLPRTDVVFHAWSDSKDGNVRPIPDGAEGEAFGEVTAAFLRRKLKRDVDAVLAIDLQRNPWPCAVGARFFTDPAHPDDIDQPLMWFSDAIVVEGGDEEALSAALVEAGYDPKRTALIIDASGSWQAIDRKKNKHRPSFDIFRGLGWPHLFKPDEKFERNPPVIERVKGANSRFKNAQGERRVFSDPELSILNQSLKQWENRNGTPYKRSDYAHLGDAASYMIFRFWPRKWTPKRTGAKGAARVQSFPHLRPGSGVRY